MKKVISMEILNYPRMGKCVLQTLENTFDTLGLDSALQEKFMKLTEWGLMTRIAKAYQEEGMLRIDLDIDPEKLILSIQDEGIPYMVRETLANPEEAKSFFDRCLLRDDEGKHYSEFSVHMEKMGRSGQCFVIELPFVYEKGMVQPAKREFNRLDTNFNIHKVTNDKMEINEAIYCIFHEYRYSYAYEDLYNLETFKSLIEAEAFHSYLVVNDHQQVAGHFGLSESSFLPGMPEICTVVIKVEFRKLQFGSKIFEYAVKAAQEIGKPALWVQPTAFHTGTQNICNKLEFIPTGFMFQYINKDVHSEYNVENRRLDVCMCVKLFDKMSFTIYCPDEIKAYVSGVFESLKSPVTFLVSEKYEEKTEISIETNLRTLSSKIVVNQVGADFQEIIDDMLAHSQQNKLEMLELMLSLECVEAVGGYEYLRKQGFIFSGILPGGGDGVYCVMQHLCGAKPAFDKMVTMSPYTEVLEELKAIYEGGQCHD